MAKLALSLGSNIEPRLDYLQKALFLIEKIQGITLENCSKIYQTPAWGVENQADFLNLCCLCETNLPPLECLKQMQQIEQNLGRIRLEKWGARTLDIDLIYYDSLEMATEELTLPHPFATQRAFVLFPLAEIAANYMLQGKSIKKWTENFESDSVEVYKG